MPTNKITQQTIRLGIDIGGTFTDFVIFDPTTGKISTFKLPSTPHDPSAAVLTGIRKLSDQISRQPDNFETSSKDLVNNSTNPPFHVSIIHGSTVATNALLEHKGATTALVTTRGFKDVIQIGRQNRPKLYDFASAPPDPLVPQEFRFEINERIDRFGEIIVAADPDEINQLVTNLQSSFNDLQSVAVVFLFSFANPVHEQLVTKKLRDAGYSVSASHEILPEYREYERTSTTVVNAYVSPVLDRYLAKLETGLNLQVSKDTSQSTTNHQSSITYLQIMQSNGGSISVSEARRSGVRCILSGPAGGVVGCQYIGSLASENLGPSDLRLLTFDMGGTSTDVSLINGKPLISSEAEVGGFPIRVPVLDIHTIGAGGGSIAFIDPGGALRVGPQSAGADPGPACYGRNILDQGSEIDDKHPPIHHTHLATVTDANLLLGRIPADRFLGGDMPLYPDLAEAAINLLSASLGLSLTQTALGIIEIANAHMERGLRVISVERGHDPREFTLLSFGGAGSLHAADLARRLGIPQVLIPPYAATLSAFGMLAADVIKDYTHTVMLSGNTPIIDIKNHISRLMERAIKEIQIEGFAVENIRLEPALDMRYRGQSYELTIPFTENYVEDFHENHHLTYGYLRPEANLEIVNIRVRGTGLVASPQIAAHPLASSNPVPALIEYRNVVFGVDQSGEIPFYQGEALKPGNIIPGPAVVLCDDTTILIGQFDSAFVDQYLNLFVNIDC